MNKGECRCESSPLGVLTEETHTNETEAPGRATGTAAREGASDGSLKVQHRTERKQNAAEASQPVGELANGSKDRGSTYASTDYREALESRGIQCSMSRKGDCWDNAVAESFFATLKREMENSDDLESRQVATLSIREYIDGFYNFQRRHSAINYNSPVEFELIHFVQQAA